AITTQPQPKTVTSGQNASFSVGASGSGLVYQWRKDGNNIAGASTSSISLNNVRLAQAGNYSVVITNSGGSVTSSNATLTVNMPSPPAFSFLSTASGQAVVSFTPVLGLTNNVLATASPDGGWTLFTNFPPPPDATPISFSDALVPGNRFYRIEIDP